MPPRQRSSLPYKALSVARSWGNLRAIYRNSAILRFRSPARQYTSPWHVKLNIWVPSSPITTSVPSHWNTASANARRPTAAFVKCSKDAGASPYVNVYSCGNPQSYLVLSMDLGLAVSPVHRSSDYTKSCSNSSEL